MTNEQFICRATDILANMAQENTGWWAWFNRWPIHHEPLRTDAQNLLKEWSKK